MNKKHITSTIVVAAMAASAVGALSVLEDWLGDWLGPVWVLSGFFVPFVLGIALGGIHLGRGWAAAGALAGGAVVGVPAALYFAINDRDLSAFNLPLLWGTFVPLAMASGAISMPVGVTARRRGRPA